MLYKNKRGILLHYEESIDWVNSLKNLTEEKWRLQIDEGKWTIAEIIGHLIPWDELVLNQRIPYLIKAESLPTSPNAETVNQQAAQASRSRSKDETIHSFIDTRKRLIKALYDLTDELWTRDLLIGRNNLSLIHYFAGLVKHDLHHFKQIQRVLYKKEMS